MEKPRTVGVYGNSLFIAGIEASLQAQSGLEVSRIATASPDSTESLAQGCPDVIVFDLASAQPPVSISFLAEHPRLTLIGLDLKSNSVLVLSGKYSRVLTTNHLLRLILDEPAEADKEPAAPLSPDQINSLFGLGTQE